MRTHLDRALPYSDFTLERYLAGELDDATRAEIERTAARHPALAAHLEARRAARAAFALAPRPGLPAPRFEWTRRLALGLPALAAAAALLLFLAPRGTSPERDPGAGVRGRGALSVELVVNREGRTFRHRPGTELRANDRVRVQLLTPGVGFVTVVNVDDSGARSVYYDVVPVTPGRVVLPGSLVLDDHVGRETLSVAFAPRPLPGAALLRALGDGAEIEPDAILVQIELEKGAPR